MPYCPNIICYQTGNPKGESSFQSWLQGASPSQIFFSTINTDCTQKITNKFPSGKAGLISLDEKAITPPARKLAKEIRKYISLSPLR